MTDVNTLYEGGSFFESPRWHDGRWWVSDFFDKVVWTLSTDGAAEQVLTVPNMPSGLGWLPDGSLLIVSMGDQRILRRTPDGAVSVHADISDYCGGSANDMVVSAAGHAYVGNFGTDDFSADSKPSNLVRVAPDGTASVAAENLLFPNGAVITPDGGTFIVAETLGGRFTAFTIADDGSLTDRRVWSQVCDTPDIAPMDDMLGRLDFAPDGCTLDADGHIWTADIVGRRLARVAQGGSIVEQIRLPEGLMPFACALGGEDGRTLLVCAAPDLDAARTPTRGGVLVTLTVSVPRP